MVSQLLPILPGLHTLDVGYGFGEEDQGSLASVLKERFEMDDEDRRHFHVYLKGGTLTRQDRESLEGLVAGLHLENVTVIDEV
ncbi:hypothetical protein M407DRAFT_241042, partial [Tulasnella calospora MUT 4182]